MNVEGRIRNLLTDCVDAWDGETDWWAPLAAVDPSYFVRDKLKKIWAEMNKEDRARWLIGQLWNCTNICPRDVADSLNIPGGTYASVVRCLAVTDPPDEFAELIRRVKKRQQQRQEDPQEFKAIFFSP